VLHLQAFTVIFSACKMHIGKPRYGSQGKAAEARAEWEEAKRYQAASSMNR
jgi:hypothetical protein